jgi:hypothetical protein
MSIEAARMDRRAAPRRIATSAAAKWIVVNPAASKA